MHENTVTLRVEELAGFERTIEPVRSGVPFPKGALIDPGQVRLVAGHSEVPMDAQVLAKWDDGSIKWLLLDFQTSLQPHEGRDYALEYGPGISSNSQAGLKIEENDEYLRVDTGAARFEISKNTFGILKRFFVRANQGWTLACDEGIDIVARNYVYRNYTTKAPECEYFAEVEERGSVHAVIKVTGTLVWRAKEVVKNTLSYTLRLYCCAGSPDIRLTFTLKNRQQEAYEILRSLEITAPLVDASANIVAGWGNDSCGHFELGAQPDMLILQTGPTNLRPWEQFSCAVIDSEGRIVDRRDKSPGWAALEEDALGVCAAVRNFWQKHPKGFRFEPGLMAISLHPMHAEHFVLSQGMKYTDDVLLSLYTPATRQASLRSAAAFGHPLFAKATPQWYCESGAMGWLSPVDDHNFRRYEQLLRQSFDSLVRGQEQEAMYGALNFGDTSGDYTTQRDYWLNQEYDTPHCCFMMFARSGDTRYLDWGRDAARHQADVDTIHFCTDNLEAIGSQYKHEWAHISYRHGIDQSHKGPHDHIWAEGLCECYLLTGDRRSLEIARGVGDFLIKRVGRGLGNVNPRSYGWPLVALCAIYETTGDEKYLEGAADVVRQALARNHPTRGIWQDKWGVDEHGREILGNKIFMVGVLMEGMAQYHRITGDEDVKIWLAKTGRTICDEGWVEKDKGFYYTPSLADRDKGRTTDLRELMGLAYAYKLSGDKKLIRIAQESFDAGQDAILKQLEGGIMSGKGFTTLARSTPRFMAMARELGVWRDDRPVKIE